MGEALPHVVLMGCGQVVPDRSNCSNAADNEPHRTVTDKLIGERHVVFTRYRHSTLDMLQGYGLYRVEKIWCTLGLVSLPHGHLFSCPLPSVGVPSMWRSAA